MPNNGDKQLEFPIEWNIPDDIVARYATNMIIQRGENEFFISFFEVKPPLILGTPEQIEEQARNIKTVQANCVAQVIVSMDKMPSFIEALDSGYKRSIALKDANEEIK